MEVKRGMSLRMRSCDCNWGQGGKDGVWSLCAWKNICLLAWFVYIE